MGWKQVSGGNVVDIKKEKGKAWIGIYKGHKEIETKIGQQTIWKFIDDDGMPFGVYGFTNLNRAMESVPVESLCRITYVGTQNIKTKYGMKDVHQVSVEVDSDEPDSADTPETKIPF